MEGVSENFRGLGGADRGLRPVALSGRRCGVESKPPQRVSHHGTSAMVAEVFLPPTPTVSDRSCGPMGKMTHLR
jgi:hypothetical protein